MNEMHNKFPIFGVRRMVQNVCDHLSNIAPLFIQQEELEESGAPPLKKICSGENAVMR